MKIDESHFSELCLLPRQELLDYSRRVTSLIDVVHGSVAPVSLPELKKAPPPPPADIMSLNLPQRSPMRIPQAGSVRASVHEVLRSAGQPLRRLDVIKSVAIQRGVVVDKLLEAKVSDALGNRHDLLIQKVGKGVYAFVKEGRDASLCL